MGFASKAMIHFHYFVSSPLSMWSWIRPSRPENHPENMVTGAMGLDEHGILREKHVFASRPTVA